MDKAYWKGVYSDKVLYANRMDISKIIRTFAYSTKEVK